MGGNSGEGRESIERGRSKGEGKDEEREEVMEKSKVTGKQDGESLTIFPTRLLIMEDFPTLG